MSKRKKEEDMEVVGYECYANGTIKLKIMPIKDAKNGQREEEQFYGSGIVSARKKKNASKHRPFLSKRK
ncbi:hypothetical protein [Hydrogenimonas urashimensis]|uniref:hypothetical protein n=1 Tax=Hydrogenimonas urashimensis TaxID=2740515 RepID=UPI0019161284|nr:hypothetical protein [Hydrogenimonas urashimensis]